MVIDLQILADTGAYETLERNMQRLGFERGYSDSGTRVSWRWQTKTERGATMILEFLADDPAMRGGRVQELPTKGNISALNVPHSSIVFDLFDEKQVRVELLDERGVAEVTIKHANIVSFTCLKAFAYEDRLEPKDAHDLVYTISHRPEGVAGVAAAFRAQTESKHGAVIRSALEILRRRFVDEPGAAGYTKDGPVAVARFELGNDADQRDRRVLRQREASDIMASLLKGVGLVTGT
ncbi:MAG: antitoxin [Steroidobacteraceae bacterium]